MQGAAKRPKALHLFRGPHFGKHLAHWGPVRSAVCSLHARFQLLRPSADRPFLSLVLRCLLVSFLASQHPCRYLAVLRKASLCAISSRVTVMLSRENIRLPKVPAGGGWGVPALLSYLPGAFEGPLNVGTNCWEKRSCVLWAWEPCPVRPEVPEGHRSQKPAVLSYPCPHY